MYIAFGLLLCWILCVQLGCMAMRTPDKDWQPKLQKLGQSQKAAFHDVHLPDGRNIHAISIGTASALPVLFFVHGSPGSADACLNYLGDTALSRQTKLVTIDRPGFGYSDFGKPEPSLAKQAAAVKAIADKVAPNQPLILVGHSMGAPVIVRFAIDYPALTAGLVLVAGSVDPAQEAHPWWQKAVDNPPLSWLTPKSLWASNYEIRRLEQELDKMMPFWANIRCPVTILHAVDDQLVPYANVAFARQQLVHAAPLTVKTFDSGNHFILWNRYNDVKNAIQEMIK